MVVWSELGLVWFRFGLVRFGRLLARFKNWAGVFFNVLVVA